MKNHNTTVSILPLRKVDLDCYQVYSLQRSKQGCFKYPVEEHTLLSSYLHFANNIPLELRLIPVSMGYVGAITIRLCFPYALHSFTMETGQKQLNESQKIPQRGHFLQD